MKKSRIILSMLLVGILLSTLGCATSVAFNVLKPAEVNMSSYRSLAVYEFTPYEFSGINLAQTIILDVIFGKNPLRPSGYSFNLENDIAKYLTTATTRALQSSNYFSILPPEQAKVYQKAAASGASVNNLLIAQGVDAVFSGSITDMDFDEYVESRENKVWNETLGTNGAYEVVSVDNYFIQKVYLDVTYSVIDVATGKLITSKSLHGSNSRSTLMEGDDFEAPGLYSLYTSIINDFQTTIRNQLAPYTVRQYRTMLKDKTKSPEMKMADQYVKDGLYKPAQDIYLTRWYQLKDYVSGYNAAILYEVLGDIQAALSLMQEVYQVTGSSDAYKQYERLLRVLDEYNRASEQIAN